MQHAVKARMKRFVPGAKRRPASVQPASRPLAIAQKALRCASCTSHSVQGCNGGDLLLLSIGRRGLHRVARRCSPPGQRCAGPVQRAVGPSGPRGRTTRRNCLPAASGERPSAYVSSASYNYQKLDTPGPRRHRLGEKVVRWCRACSFRACGTDDTLASTASRATMMKDEPSLMMC
jgi:hypothetical protein